MTSDTSISSKNGKGENFNNGAFYVHVASAETTSTVTINQLMQTKLIFLGFPRTVNLRDQIVFFLHFADFAGLYKTLFYESNTFYNLFLLFMLQVFFSAKETNNNRFSVHRIDVSCTFSNLIYIFIDQ